MERVQIEDRRDCTNPSGPRIRTTRENRPGDRPIHGRAVARFSVKARRASGPHRNWNAGVIRRRSLHSDRISCLAELLRGERPTSLGVTLRENIDHASLIDRDAIVAVGSPRPAMWNEWGPDLIFLRVPPEHVGVIEAHRVFHNLMRNRTLGAEALCIDLRILMGTPGELAQCMPRHADLQITGMFCANDTGRFSPSAAPRDFDYIDLDMDVTLPGVPQNFGGVSGGGLWRVFVYWSVSTREIVWAKGYRRCGLPSIGPR